MPVVPPKRGIDITEHVRQTIGHLLRTETVETYNAATGVLEDKRISDLVPGIIIRPATSTFGDLPTVELREDEAMKPFLTWIRRSGYASTAPRYGGNHKEPQFWEINVRLGEANTILHDQVSGWLKSFLEMQNEADVYFFYYDEMKKPRISRGDAFASMMITDVVEQDRIIVADARGADGNIVVNFMATIYKGEEFV